MRESEVVRMQRHAGATAMECNPPTRTPAIVGTDHGVEASAPPARRAADIIAGPTPLAISGRLSRQLNMEAMSGCEWWETDLAGLLLAANAVGPLMGVFVAIAQVLREGHDPDIVVGGISADAAFRVAQEWVDVGIDPVGVVGWLRAGCWKPTSARAMTDAGLRPWRLLNEARAPRHWVEISTATIEHVPLARAVAEGFLTVQEAISVVVRHAHAPSATARIVDRMSTKLAKLVDQ